MMRFEHRAVPIVLAAVTIDIIGFGIVVPVLPSLITQLGDMDVPATTRIAEWMLAAFAVAQFFAGPIPGSLGDRFGRRRVLSLSVAVFAPDHALMAFAQSLAWGAARGFDGLAFVIAGGLIGASALIIAFGVPHLRYAETATGDAR